MINFRFHLVSLTAVFLALAAGIVIGAGVVDQKTVEGLKDQLDTVAKRRDVTNKENQRLDAELAEWKRFSDQAGDQLVGGRLTGTRVLVVAVRGIERGHVDGLRTSLASAGASLEGTVWFTSKWKLTNDADTSALAAVIGDPSEQRQERVRAAAIALLADTWLGGQKTDIATRLDEAGFLEFEGAAGSPVALGDVPLPATSFVVVSGGNAVAAPDALPVPLTRQLAGGGARVLATEPSRDPQDPLSEKPGFIGELRADKETADRISTVDNIDDYRGRVASVLALQLVQQDRHGHYGTGPGAARLVPEPAS